MDAVAALPEEFPTPRELDLAPPIREEPKVPHPLEATRQDMQEKAPHSNGFRDSLKLTYPRFWCILQGTTPWR